MKTTRALALLAVAADAVLSAIAYHLLPERVPAGSV